MSPGDPRPVEFPLTSPRELFDAALAHHRAGDYAAAGELYRRILAQDPDQPDALNLLAAVHMEAGSHGAAAELLRRAVAVAGQVPRFHCNLGNALQGTGDLPGAEAAYRRALALDPGDADAHTGLGFALAQMGDTPQAIECYRAALAIEPRHFHALNNLGDAWRARGDPGRAADAYERALAVAPGIARVHAKLGAVMRAQGRLSDALEHLWSAVDTGEADTDTCRILGSILRNTLPAAYDSALERRVLAFFAAAGVDHAEAADFATALLTHKVARTGVPLGEMDPASIVDMLATDPLAHALLTHAVGGDPDLENALIRARRWLLLNAGREDVAMRAASVLARQCLLNEFVYAVEDDERARLGELKASIEARAADGLVDSSVQSMITDVAMYQPLAALASADALAALPLEVWHEGLRPLVVRGLLEPMEEAALAASLPTVGRSGDTVSGSVKAQYEENPYPRWTVPAYRTPENLYDILAEMFPAFEPPGMLRGPVRVLVAGCGTGHHPISIAMRYANAEVIATDISRRSLAYGMRKARELGVGNVRFVENDLLDVAALEGTFHVIECVGVLHHTRSIEAGLRALLGKLDGDGVLKIGLYSRRAREPVAHARRRISELGLTAAEDDIRAFRRRVLQAPEGDPLRDVLDYGDFYTLSNCRDLLFHVHEHEVTIEEIRELLEAENLAFIGFETADATVVDAYRHRFPDDPSLSDLARWEILEQETPRIFAGLYQFWCSRGPAG